MSSPTKRMTNAHAVTPTEEVAITPLEHKRIARLAHSYWEARGCPYGSPEEDWFRAEEELRKKKSSFDAVKDRRRSSPTRISSRSRRSAAQTKSKAAVSHS